MGMATYMELIQKDVCYHDPDEDGSLWPSSISQFVQALENELKIPSWLKSGPVPYTNQRAIDLLNRIRASDVVFIPDLWDGTDKLIDQETEQRLHVVFNSALVDCARVRAVAETEYLTGTPYPKESFLVILVRNAILDAHAHLCCLEDAPVVLPRHFGGDAIPILNYLAKSVYVPLLISICQEMPVEETQESDLNVDHQSSDNAIDNSGSEQSERSLPTIHPPPTMSEWLNASPTIRTPVDTEDEKIEVPSPRFEAHFLAHRPSMDPPSVCPIPVLCMADDEQLPVVMSSFLYQRRVWHITDPMIGLEFSKYETVIRLFVGWLDDDAPSDRALPQVHLLEVVPVVLDLSSPAVAIMLSRLFFSLGSYISGIRDAARNSVKKVFSETQTSTPLSWRIDTDVEIEETTSGEGDDVRERVLQWAENQSCSEKADHRPSNK